MNQQHEELSAEDLLRKMAEGMEYFVRSEQRVERLKALEQSGNKPDDFGDELRRGYEEGIAFLKTAAVGIIPEDKRKELIATGERRIAEVERKFGLPAKQLGYWQYPHLWPTLVVGAVIVALSYALGGAV